MAEKGFQEDKVTKQILQMNALYLSREAYNLVKGRITDNPKAFAKITHAYVNLTAKYLDSGFWKSDKARKGIAEDLKERLAENIQTISAFVLDPERKPNKSDSFFLQHALQSMVDRDAVLKRGQTHSQTR